MTDIFYRQVRRDIAAALTEDLEWLSHGRVPGQKPDPVFTPWMPFQAANFIAILAECVAVSEGRSFLDVGSGIGTKLVLARTLFGLDSWGIERDKELFRHAVAKGRNTVLAEALTCNPAHYQAADIVWMYRPFRDNLSQAKLEHKIFELMKPGAVIAGASWEHKPEGFEIVLEDLDDSGRIAGAWKKPLNWQAAVIELSLDEAA